MIDEKGKMVQMVQWQRLMQMIQAHDEMAVKGKVTVIYTNELYTLQYMRKTIAEAVSLSDAVLALEDHIREKITWLDTVIREQKEKRDKLAASIE